MSRLLRTTLCIGMLAAAAQSASAQTVRGRVIDELDGQPVAGGFVRLVRADGTFASSTLTNAGGVYQLNATPDSYRLRVERLGLQTFETSPFTLDTSVVMVLRVPMAPIEMPAVTAHADRQCDARDGMAAAAAAVWEEVQKALSVASWTAEHGNIVYELRSEAVQYDPRMRFIAERVDTTMSAAGGSPYAALDVDSLMAHGFVQPAKDGTFSYFGPDAQLILSDAFQRTHCFHAVVDRGRPDMVGLGFQPNGAIMGSDIEGTLWIDRESYELRNLEFKYTNLPEGAPRGSAEGSISFTRLDTGMWILNEWTITAPVLSTFMIRTVNGLGRAHTGYRVATHTALTAWADGKVVYKAVDAK